MHAKRDPEQPDDQDQLQPEQADGPEPGGPDDAAAEPSELDALRAERDAMESKYLRAAADLQNYARRANQNIADARDEQTMGLAKGMAVVLDHFDRALAVEPANEQTEQVLQGMRMVRDELLTALERFGVSRVEVAPGEPFEPGRHEALMHQAAEGVEPGHVAQQFQPGYVLGDKIIRPAQVAVAQ